ncbi:MAG: hypothetical protein BZ135_00460, partial [Methanosphaera sp. rholeuAM6]
TTTINNAVQDAENDEYVINLNAETYQITANTVLNAGTYKPNIIINANSQTLSANSNTKYTRFNNGCNITINDALITQRIQNYANNIIISNSNITNQVTNRPDMNLTLINSSITATLTNTQGNTVLENSYIDAKISNTGNLTITEDNILGENFSITGEGNVITNRTDLAPYLNSYNGVYTLENMVISTNKKNYGNLTIINSTITGTLSNYGNLTIINSTISETIKNYEYGNIMIYDSILDNVICQSENNYLKIHNSNVSWISIHGSAILEKSCINGSSYNYGNLTICDDVIFGDSFILSNSGNIITNRTDLAIYLTVLNGTYTLENIVITVAKDNYGNLTIRNATIDAQINNYGNLTIGDDVIFGEHCFLNEFSPITIDDKSRIFPYMRVLNGKYTLENMNISYINNYGELTVLNSTFERGFHNYGDFTLRDSVTNGTIYTNGTLLIVNSTINSQINTLDQCTLILGDNITIGETFAIKGDGIVITNDTEKFLSYMPTFSGNITLENGTFTENKINYGNLTLINYTTKRITNEGNLTVLNSTLNGEYTNNENLIILNSTINQQITNNGILTITNSTINNKINNNGTLKLEGDIELGISFSLTGDGQIIADDGVMSKIFRYLTAFYGENTVELGDYGYSSINNYGKLTIINSEISNNANTITNNANSELTLINTKSIISTTNNGRLELKNSTISGTLENNGILIISDDSTLGYGLRITGNGEIIINDTQRLADCLTTYNGNFV